MFKSLASRSRSAFDENGQRLKDTRCIGIRDGLCLKRLLTGSIQRSDTLFAYGEENRDWGGAFRCLSRPD